MLAADPAKIHNQIFNVGDTTHNYRVRDIGEIVAEVFPNSKLSFGSQPSDNRSYLVNFDKIHETFPDYICHWDAKRGTLELRDIFEQIPLTTEIFEAPAFTRLKALEKHLHENKLDPDFFWK